MGEVGERKLDGRNLILDSTTPKVMSGWIGWILGVWIQDHTS